MNSQPFAVQFGKVRINTALNSRERILTSTSRISAFDCVLPFEVESKGQILQAISTYFFTTTRDIVANHFIGCLDAHSMLVKSGRVLPLEIIARATLSGSLWRCYSQGGPDAVLKEYGVVVPAGLKQHARFATPIVTFTTKAAFGHDVTVTPTAAAKHVAQWLNDEDHSASGVKLHAAIEKIEAHSLVTQVQATALKLFERGQQVAQKAKLLLLDTKYEFALDEHGQLMLVDEIHTPDASRYVDLEKFNKGETEHLSKEWLREIIQTEVEKFEKSASAADKNLPFILRPFWKTNELKEKLAKGLSEQYKKLFSRIFPQLTPWDLISPHLIPWPIEPTAMRVAEAQQRLPSRILVVGNGGRDFTLANYIEKAAEVDVVYCWPGRASWNGGKIASLQNLNTEQLLQFCAQENIGWAVFGPEIPIAQGIAEKFRELNIPCLAPDLAGAMLESSKIHTKNVLRRADCPTAESWTLGWSELKSYATGQPAAQSHTMLDEYPYVLKYESLAAGKGVCLVFNESERRQAIRHFEENLPAWVQELETLAVDTYTRRLGEPQFLVEKLLPGKEISAIALCHGQDFVLLPYAQDFKRRDDGQSGPNTGGMGSVCPVSLPAKLDEQIHTLFSKTLKTLAADGQPYRGFLFAGLMVDANNNAQVLEFNCRLGDPETQVLLPGLGRDVLLNMWLTSKNLPWSLNPWRKPEAPHSVRHDGLKRCFVVVASPEYPNGRPPKRTLSLPQRWPESCLWIPSGVDAENQTSAGRIGGVLCADNTPERAVEGAYALVRQITFATQPALVPHFRSDVTFPSMAQES